MEVNTDMKKHLRGGYTGCVPGCYSNTKRDKELPFHKFPNDVFFLVRNELILSRVRIIFLVSSTVYAQSIFLVTKSKADQTSLLYFHCFLSPNRESLQKYVCHLNLQPKGRKLELENQKH